MKRSFVLPVLVGLVCTACRESGLPKPGSQRYTDMCSAFFLGVAGLQAGEDIRAREYLTRSTQIAPGEPAGWADLGILQVRQQQFDAASASFDKARSLAPEDSRIEAMVGLVESRRGHLPEAIAHLKKAVELDQHNLKALYSLAEETERDQRPGSEDTAQHLLRQILKQQPDNAAVLLDDLRLAAKRGDTTEVKQALSAIRPLAAFWPEAAQQQLAMVEKVGTSGNVRPAAVQVQFLRNVLLRVPSYRASLDQVKTSANLVAQPFVRFLRVPSPTSEPAVPDSATHFDAATIPSIAGGNISWLGELVLDATSDPVTAWADGSVLHLADGVELPLPPGNGATLGKSAVAAADLDYDFKADLVIATTAGLKIYRQEEQHRFLDITAASKIPAAIANGSYSGVWPLDVDLDGDLDLVLGRTQGAPVVLRNNNDGTFAPIDSFPGVDGETSFVVADMEGDGDPDVALVDRNGNLNVLMNERGGRYRLSAVPAEVSHNAVAVAAADVDGNSTMDLVVLKNDGTVMKLSIAAVGTDGTPEWRSASLLRAAATSSPSLFVADLDNNGALDIVANNQVFLSDGKTFTPSAAALSATPQAVSDLNRDGRLDLIALNKDNAPVAMLNRGTKNYHWQIIRTKAAQAAGDQRINSFGIGGEIEIRSALLTQKQIIASPFVHFGLGDHTEVPFARIVWPNGTVQAEFDLKAGQTILATQRIKGSCPMLFTWNGHEMQFVKDVGPWGSGLGINVNAEGKGIYGTTEWFNVSGDQLVARNGLYEMRLTDEYWETYYLDHYSLLVVDHPADSEVYTDERYYVPSQKPGLIATSLTKPFLRAIDDHGADVTETVRKKDDEFLDTFGRGQYQGLTRDHWVELELPGDAPASGPLYLVADGWTEDTEESLMKAQEQNSKAHEKELSIEVQSENGAWSAVRSQLGFPKGRFKTVVLDITGIFHPGCPRKLRLRTNLEIYWNRLAWASGLPAGEKASVQQIGASSADLRYRGFSLITKANSSSPEVAHYAVVQNSDLRWRNQEGYATRYGDVRELLENIDDRYVITSPGDELGMTFAAPPAPAPGWKRDFILICDGWVKDGDYNSNFAETVLPLPYHAMKHYDTPPTTLEADPVYQLHPEDWRTYHTRYVTSRDFISALWRR
ncbi:MAG TPA: FG-GAP-like repeat-containing protein [Bryobacteraceae bacterium]|nr:FG-GAP-like repeat-containing protein [Bryobacteraceae bacterium]